jgi:splicing factor 3B subunit 3
MSNSNINSNNQGANAVKEEEQKSMETEDSNNASPAKESADSGIPVSAVAMKLLDVRLKPSSAISKSVIGEFTRSAIASKTQQIVVARTGGVLELYVISSSNNRGGSGSASSPSLKLEDRLETRSIIRDLVAVRLVGEKRDVLAVSSDSGCLSIIDFENTNHNTDTASTLVTSPFGKTGCRRSTPGQHLASDPKGRAICVSATEKRKLVYVLNQNQGSDAEKNSNNNGSNNRASIALASPLEAHRTRTLCLATVGVDNGYDNPLFACLEVQYVDPEDAHTQTTKNGSGSNKPPNKQLAYYELDLGLNHVSRKWAVDVDSSSYCLAALPGYGDGGPSGVLVGSEDTVTWYHNGKNGKDGVSCKLPKRAWDSDPTSNIKTLVTQLTVHRQKRNKFFGLCQTEVGDVFKIDFGVSSGINANADAMDTTGSSSSDPTVDSLTVALLDTLPPSNSLNVSKKGLLFCATEFGGTMDHGLYQFEKIDLPDAPTSKSSSSSNNSTEQLPLVTYTPSPKLQNLIKIDGLDNLSPTTGVLVGELTGGMEVSPQIYALGGRGPSACLRTLRHGCSVTELAVSELPGVPGAIFAVDDLSKKETSGDDGDGDDTARPLSKYIVVSFADATLVLSVGDTVEEVGRESGFLTNAPTLACTALRDGSCCQIHPIGVRHIQTGQAMEWHVPGLNKIECASANEMQVVIALAGGEVIYFELDRLNDKLTEGPKRRMKADVCCLDVGVIETGRERSLFCAVGCRDSTVQIISLEPGPDKLLKSLGLTTLQSRPNSVKLLPQPFGGDLILMVGMDDGSSLRATVDPITGAIGTSPTRRFMGARPVSVARIPIEGKPSLMLLSSRPWISRSSGATTTRSNGKAANTTSNKHIMAPLSYTPLDHGCAFSSEAVPEGVVATAGKTLRIVSVDASGLDGNDDEAFNTNKVGLRYTPRQMTLLSAATEGAAGASSSEAPKRKVVLAIVESDYNDYGRDDKIAKGFHPDGAKPGGKSGKEAEKDDDAMDMDEDSDEEEDAERKKDGETETVKKEGGDGEGNDEEEDEEEDEDEIEARRTPLRGPIPPGGTSWGSCIRLVDPSNSCSTLDCLELGRNEAALCCTSVRFHTFGGESLLAVGTVTGMTLHPLKQKASHVALYRIINGERLRLLHKTTMNASDGPILAMAHFQGRLLVGLGTTLRLYEMGKRQLLRKCELKGLPTFVKTLQTAGDRYVFDDCCCVKSE